MTENEINDNLTNEFNSNKASFDKAQKELDFYTENADQYRAKKSSLQTKYDIIQERHDKARPELQLQCIDLRKDMNILDLSLEKNRSDAIPWEVETEQLRGTMNASRIAMEEHRRTMSKISPSDIEYLKSQHSAGKGSMAHNERMSWINKLDGGIEEFNKLVPMLSK